jgi:hypothetical protein
MRPTEAVSLRTVVGSHRGMRSNAWWWRRAFIYVGRISKYKGVPQIVAAWRKLADSGDCPPLWLIGGAPEEIQAMREHLGADCVSDLEAAGRLVWWGYLDSAGISAVLTRAVALVTHSRYEPGGRVILEAMAEGVPVIATPHGFARDLVRDWHNGFLVQFDDVERLGRCMAHFLNQPLLRSVLGESARSDAAKALDEWSFVHTHFTVYDAAASGGHLLTPLNQPPRVLPKARFRRRLPSHYPFLDREPSIEKVQAFFRQAVGAEATSCRQLPDLADSSILWQFQGGGDRWVIKWPASRVESRPIWDPSRSRPLFRSSAERFRSEMLASDLPGFAPVHAGDERHGLLLRPQLSVSSEIVKEETLLVTGALYRWLYSYRPEAPWIEDLDQDWRHASWEELDDALATAQGAAKATGAAWDLSRHISLRLARRRLEFLLRSPNRPPLEEPLLSQAHDGLCALTEVAEEEGSLPVVVCHGSAGWRHVAVSRSGGPILLDGEHVHPGWPGEDYASLLLDLVPVSLQPDQIVDLFESHLPVLVPGSTQRAVTRAWLAVLVLEDLLRISMMDLGDDFPECSRRWQAVRRLISDVTL